MKKIDLTKAQLKKYVDLQFEVKDVKGKIKKVNVSLTLKEISDIISKLQEAKNLDVIGIVREVFNIGKEFDDDTVLLMVEALNKEVEKLDQIPRDTFKESYLSSIIR